MVIPPLALVAELGRARAQRLHAALVAHATEWARAAAEETVCVAAADLRSAVRDSSGPLLVAAATTPRLTAGHADMALGDLAAGADVSFGPGIHGGWYLAGLFGAHEPALDLLAGDHEQLQIFSLAADSGLEVGLLRAERLLRSAADVRALIDDPLVAPAWRALLR